MTKKEVERPVVPQQWSIRSTPTAANLQVFIALMEHWPAEERHRPAHMSPREILVDNADLRFRPLKRSALENGYVATVQAIIRYGMTFYESPNPFHGAKLRYPATAAPRQSTEPLSSEQKNRIFRAGVESGLLDEALLPLVDDLTGRRLGLLVHEKLLKLPQMMQHWANCRMRFCLHLVSE